MEVTKAIVVFLLIISCNKQEERFVRIEGGEFSIGENENLMNPLRDVFLDTYTISKYELTNQEFKAFVDATNYVTDAEKYNGAMVFDKSLPDYEWKKDSTANWKFPQGKSKGGIKDKMNHPVTCVSFNDAMAYCDWANVRLPLLAEWEVASRGKKMRNTFLKKI